MLLLQGDDSEEVVAAAQEVSAFYGWLWFLTVYCNDNDDSYNNNYNHYGDIKNHYNIQNIRNCIIIIDVLIVIIYLYQR